MLRQNPYHILRSEACDGWRTSPPGYLGALNYAAMGFFLLDSDDCRPAAVRFIKA